ncbi:hypothetical protein HIM_04140 [Hirsutella minnesotensis 3608]|uniref:Riboflavin kinase n=1 Tax=Hirsutella minnesotensis 3608 TaxID=1043627 RepID=A0A0F7ZLH3_9HYPO|nr:hypothetical protein HIM_04140 [Hirsutella minnesotensis 3608]
MSSVCASNATVKRKPLPTESTVTPPPPPPYTFPPLPPYPSPHSRSPPSPAHLLQSQLVPHVHPQHHPRLLRPSRSATQLRLETHDNQHSPRCASTAVSPAASQGSLPVDFVADGPPLPDTRRLSPCPSHASGPDLRRVHSSSGLSTVTTSGSTGPKEPSKWKAALGEAQYVAGGLISRPSESTRHYTVIRHSHALVWYRGPSTSVSVTILSDDPLPVSRSVWLQAKGFSGDVGMTVKALVGSTASWIDVTPARRARTEDLRDADERAFQRDLARFASKASGKLRKHMPRETLVVRIPAAAADGYFRLVVCAAADGKRVLCGSPVFRIASTSANVAVVRGASLTTMPIEVGVKVATTIGQQVAKKYVGVAGMIVQNRAQKVLKSSALQKPLMKSAGQAAGYGYTNLGLGNAVQESWKRTQASGRGPLTEGQLLEQAVEVIGSDDGPETPFPLKFEGKVVQGSGWSTTQLGIPTANLAQVPEAIKVGLRGVFAAWAMILPSKGLQDVSNDWHEAIVTMAPSRDAPPSVAVESAVSVHFAHDFDGATFFGARVRVLLMGYLRPAEVPDAEVSQIDLHVRDVTVTIASLGREDWAPHETVAQMQAVRSQRSFPERLTEATGKVREQVDRLPLHWAGVRSESGAWRDQMYGNGGLWIPR